MKRRWTEEELIERWTLAPDELSLLGNKSGATRLGFAVLLRFFAGEGRFPMGNAEVANQVVSYLARHVGVPAGEYQRYDWRGRSIKYHRAQVRAHFGFREATEGDTDALGRWLLEDVLPREHDSDRLREAVYKRCREGRTEPPSSGRIERLVSSTTRAHHETFCQRVCSLLSGETLRSMAAFLKRDEVLGCSFVVAGRLIETRPLGPVFERMRDARRGPTGRTPSACSTIRAASGGGFGAIVGGGT